MIWNNYIYYIVKVNNMSRTWQHFKVNMTILLKSCKMKKSINQKI